MAHEYEGEIEIIESPFPTLVDPGYYRESRKLYVRRDDGGFWLGFLPEENTGVQLKVRTPEIFLEGERVDSSEYLDVMRRVEPVKDETCGFVAMGDGSKVAEIDIPFEEWIFFNCVVIEKLVMDGSDIREVYLERYYDEEELWEVADRNPFAI